VANRSQSYTLKMKEILGDRVHLSSPIVSMVKKGGADASSSDPTYELFTSDSKSLGVFDEVIFACHPPTTKDILASAIATKEEEDSEDNLLNLLGRIEYADNVVYVHSDPKLMPARRRAWASWNCLGKSKLLQSYKIQKSKKSEAMEGGESGFGNKAINQNFKATTNDHGNGRHASPDEPLEGEDGRMKAVYVTYWLNRLQNLKTEQDIFVSLNPHQPPAPELIHKRVHLAHPQFSPATLQARKELKERYQGEQGLWFCGAWEGYGFHEDGCRSGFEVATKLSGVALPWANDIVKVLPSPDLSVVKPQQGLLGGSLNRLHKALSYDLPVAICKRFMLYFLHSAVQNGQLQLRMNDGSLMSFGDGSPCGCDNSPVTLRVFDEWMFVKIVWEYDLGLARSYMAGHFNVEPLRDPKNYDNVLRPVNAADETTVVLGDPVGLTRLFLLLLGNRNRATAIHTPGTSYKGYSGANAIDAGVGLLSKIGSFLNFIRYRLTMDNSERGGSLKNIHAHYDLSNDLFTSFLDKETLMYSSAIYDAVKSPTGSGLVFRGTLEEAQWRKLDTLLDRAQIQPGQTVLDIGFGWGGLSLHAARKYGCKVTGITLSVEQKALAENRVEKEGLGHLITFEVVDYRTFARRKENQGRFDRVLSCEMIEAVGHDHLVEFYWAVEQLLARDGVLVMEAITTTEERYEQYRRSTDFISSIIFPGSCCPSLHALVDAAYKGSRLSLEYVDNIGLHYAQTLAEWRRRFNANEPLVRELGFDDVFLRCWNYYMSYCEAGFYARNVNCLILVFGRQGCKALGPLYESRSVTQLPALTDGEVSNWLSEAD
jgi:cyclopropane-fatty-acyl-phospholipid synthase